MEALAKKVERIDPDFFDMIFKKKIKWCKLFYNIAKIFEGLDCEKDLKLMSFKILTAQKC